MNIDHRDTDKPHGYILVNNAPFKNGDSHIVTDILNSVQKMQISFFRWKSRFYSINLVVDATNSSTISPLVHVDDIIEEDTESRVTKTAKKLISTE